MRDFKLSLQGDHDHLGKRRHLPRCLPRVFRLIRHPTLQVSLEQFWMEVPRTGHAPGLVYQAVLSGQKVFIYERSLLRS